MIARPLLGEEAGSATSTESGQEADVRRQIEAKNQEIKKLEEEAQKYREALEEVGRETKTLDQAIRTLDRAIKRLDANIRLTNAKISRANLEIEALGIGIREKETSIADLRRQLGQLVEIFYENDLETPIEILMKHKTIAAFFTSLERIVGVQRGVQSALAELRQAREELRNRKANAEQKKLELAALFDFLNDQKALQAYERRERNLLLEETRNQERRYQALLSEVERKREALQQEINALEAGLVAEFDPALLPAAGSGVLSWPLSDPIVVTQYFGRTAFALAGGYNGQGHNGIDFRAAVGTPIFAAEQGIVRASGDTDLACRRASYGRWVLLDHPNGLATLYAHLSLIKVRPGDAVNRGEVMGFSGRTGYATGPHLHFTVFVRQAVDVGQLKSRVCGRTMILPLSPFGGYLNPLSYL